MVKQYKKLFMFNLSINEFLTEIGRYFESFNMEAVQFILQFVIIQYFFETAEIIIHKQAEWFYEFSMCYGLSKVEYHFIDTFMKD